MFRREWRTLAGLGALTLVLSMTGPALANSAGPAPYPETRQVLAELASSGRAALAHYRRSERQAMDENRPYIADLFRAVATSQAIVNRNFEGLLTELGGETGGCADTPPPRATTRQNLIAAIQHEIRETDRLYPAALERILHEGHPVAVALLEQAVRAQQLRRSDMREIRLGARFFYNKLEKEVRRRAPIYYICQQSGTMLINELPAVCPVRGATTSSYRPLHRIPAAIDLQACRSEAGSQRL